MSSYMIIYSDLTSSGENPATFLPAGNEVRVVDNATGEASSVQIMPQLQAVAVEDAAASPLLPTTSSQLSKTVNDGGADANGRLVPEEEVEAVVVSEAQEAVAAAAAATAQTEEENVSDTESSEEEEDETPQGPKWPRKVIPVTANIKPEFCSKSQVVKNPCSVSRCSFKGDPNRSFHAVPQDNPEEKRKWMATFDLTCAKLVRKSAPTVCSSHFRPEDFVDPRPTWRSAKKRGRPTRTLKPGALPSIKTRAADNPFPKNVTVEPRPTNKKPIKLVAVKDAIFRESQLEALIRNRDYDRAVDKVYDMVGELESCLNEDDGIRPYERMASGLDQQEEPPASASEAEILQWQNDRIKRLTGRIRVLEDMCYQQKETVAKFYHIINS